VGTTNTSEAKKLLKEEQAKLDNKLKTSYLLKKRPGKNLKKSPAPYYSFNVKAYATSDYYDLESLKSAMLESGAYEYHEIDKEMPDNFLFFRTKYPAINEVEPRHIFIFLDGAVVFWNLSNEEQNFILQLLEKFEKNPYPKHVIDEECEFMTYSRLNQETESANERQGYSFNLNLTRLLNNHIYFSDFNNDTDEQAVREHLLEKYAFSDAIAVSVKLGIWEMNLDDFSERVDFIADDLKMGKRLKISNEEVLKYLGELLTMRHVVNLHSNYLDFPDFYWVRSRFLIY
jgi:uncharacterized Rmd1/YagE family protein